MEAAARSVVMPSNAYALIFTHLKVRLVASLQVPELRNAIAAIGTVGVLRIRCYDCCQRDGEVKHEE